MDKHLIESQFDSFFEKLKRKKKIKYEFEIDSTWYEYHGKMEMLNDDVIEGVSERFIDGDDGASKIIIQWMYDETLNEVSVYKKLEYDEGEAGVNERQGFFELNHDEFDDLKRLFIN